ncbi:hypothetical protein ZPAH1_orf00136 [Aeromonas phage ZPAH1]|nr:hypothetical protein ASwh1_87 [Aeromonas phage Aswh_1]QQG33898.1 hypothetical protein ZPAH1_orf00136 [Aeromonas phage ZPAH1]
MKISLEMLIAKYGRKARIYDVIMSEFKVRNVRCVKRGMYDYGTCKRIES